MNLAAILAAIVGWMKNTDIEALFEAILAMIEQLFPAQKAKGDQRRVEAFPVLSIIRTLLSLLPLPALTDKEGCRTWLGKVLAILQDLSAQTASTLDDQTVKFLNGILADQATWDLAWSVFQKILARNDDSDLVMADPEAAEEVDALGRAVGIDPMTILAIISLVVNVLKFFRERNTD